MNLPFNCSGIAIRGFPRSGSHLIRQILYYRFGLQSRYKRVARSDNPVEFDRSWEGTDNSPGCRVVYSHEGLDPSIAATVMYVHRDGRAAYVSLSHFLRDFFPTAWPAPGLLERLIRGTLPNSNWSTHVRNGMNTEPVGGKVVVSFADMVRAPERVVAQWAECLDLAPQPCTKQPTFAEMHARYPKFIRHGNDTGWRQEWSDALQALFLDIHGEMFRALGYSETWE